MTDQETLATTGTPHEVLTAQARQYLEQTRPWVRLMAIFGFIFGGLMVLGAVTMVLVGSLGQTPEDVAASPLGANATVAASLGYLLGAVLYGIPAIYLHRYARAIGRMAADDSGTAVEDALKQQRSFWRFAGLAALVTAVVAVLGFVAALILPVIARMTGA